MRTRAALMTSYRDAKAARRGAQDAMMRFLNAGGDLTSPDGRAVVEAEEAATAAFDAANQSLDDWDAENE